ncbi:MAG: hypothetical protein AVO39_00065 [delta proteobacterium MLS_D]|jgi:UDP-N-acetylmuramoylalanine--D-glutamate ligase|nr:MAG: hypothetical protein AVO39_00065 [delta proteobacterium MLS_D]
MNLLEENILVYGIGATGIAAARFLAGEGAGVLAVDDRPLSELHEAEAALGKIGVNIRGGFAGSPLPREISLVVASPGVPPSNQLLREAEAKGVDVISEIELASRFIQAPIIAVTGTNGKTTTTEFIAHILRRWGKRIFVGGNIGNPLVNCAGRDDDIDFLVVEVSSFQLQRIRYFHPRIAVLLNVGSDHLDYHGSIDAYHAAKSRVFENMKADDLAILNADDPHSSELERSIEAEVLYFSVMHRLERGIFADGERLILKTSAGEDEVFSRESIRLVGRHNLENIMAGIVAVRHCGCPAEAIREGLATFVGPPHRMEHVATREDITYYNDSKGTNADAVSAALESCERPVVLLMGGRDKGENFGRLANSIRRKVRKLVLFGEAAPVIETALGGLVAITMKRTLGEAVDEALMSARRGDTVLLSPGCSSFDEFRDYRERGEFFRDRVLSAAAFSKTPMREES